MKMVKYKTLKRTWTGYSSPFEWTTVGLCLCLLCVYAFLAKMATTRTE